MSFKKARGFQMLLTTLTLGVALLMIISIESASAQGVLVTDTITSPSLEGNLLDDPATRNMTIYLPPGYDTSDRRYPVLYLMPGLGASDRWWAYGEYSEFFALAGIALPTDFPEAGFAGMIDGLIADGELQPMIIVMPDISTMYGGSFCVNSELNGNYEDYMIEDIVPHIDENYRTLASRDSRGIAGHCMGGYCAMYLTMRHPDVFGTVASHSGMLAPVAAVVGSLEFVAAENPEGLTMTGPDPTKTWTTSLYTLSAAWSPNPDNPPFFMDLPVDENVQVREDVLQRWAVHDPSQMMPGHIPDLASLRGIYLDGGDKDELSLGVVAQMLSEALSAAGIDHKFEMFDGTHMDKMYTRLAVSLSYLSDALVGDIEANKALIVRGWEVFNQGNLDAADEIFAADYVVHNTAGAPDGHTPEAFKQTVVMQRSAFPDVHVTVVDQIAEGDVVVTRWMGTGTHQGALMGIPPTGVQITNTGILFSRVADGKIAEEWSNFDQLGMLQQLGVIPPDREDFSWGTPSEVTGDPGDPATNRAIVQRLYDEVWNAGNMAIADEIFAAEFVYHDPTHPQATDLEGYKQFVAMCRIEWPDIHITTDDTVAEEDKVACRGTVTGTHEGGAFGIPKTGKQMSWKAAVIYRFAGGKIVEAWYCGDMLGLWQQLGLIPPMMKDYSNVFFMALTPGLNMISLPLEPATPFTARSLAEHISATMVIRYDQSVGRFVGFTLAASDDGFPIQGGEGYIVNVPGGGMVAFVGAAWTRPPMPAAPPAQRDSAWAFVVSGSVLDGEELSASDGNYTVKVKNLRTGETFTEMADSTGYFAAASADLTRKAIVEAGDKLEVSVVDSNGELASGPFVHEVTLEGIRDAVLGVRLRLGHIIPEKSALLQNYPNPFNPETWIPFHLKSDASVSVRIYSISGQLIRTLDLGHRDAGIYVSRSKAAYWDGKNEAGEEVASGVYFYSITAGDFSAIRKMTVTK
jgi:steroid delta-isomerase-like uncharacterized protein